MNEATTQVLTWDMPLMHFIDATGLEVSHRQPDVYPYAYAALCRDYMGYTGMALNKMLEVETWVTDQVPHSEYSKFVLADKWLVFEFKNSIHALNFKMRWV